MSLGPIGPSDPRLRFARIEERPKSVAKANAFRDGAQVAQDDELAAQLDDIIDSISAGAGVPEKFYRAGIDVDRDRLLDEHGVMHLHLGAKNSDVLLFLVQYDEEVVLLRTGTHAELKISPPGSVLQTITAGALHLKDWAANRVRKKAAAALEEQRRDAGEKRAKAKEAGLKRLRSGLRRTKPE